MNITADFHDWSIWIEFKKWNFQYGLPCLIVMHFLPKDSCGFNWRNSPFSPFLLQIVTFGVAKKLVGYKARHPRLDPEYRTTVELSQIVVLVSDLISDIWDISDIWYFTTSDFQAGVGGISGWCQIFYKKKNNPHFLGGNWIHDFQNEFYTWSHWKIDLFCPVMMVYFFH